MEAPGYLVASAVRAVLAQRLVRRVCKDCATEHEIEPDKQQWLMARFPHLTETTFRKGRGCQTCNFTGYRGRIGVFELLEMRPDMMDALRAGDAVHFSQIARQSQGYKPLIESAMELAQQGVTSLMKCCYLAKAMNTTATCCNGG